ncbi:zinc-binding dehydrogenase [Archangium violaceum]|uniref:zinc-binding dehydrogenase n=1 Tax=Archangium violaceum TaxID=83451 RepID=UPI00193C4F2D|nr:zinc-binding dehydrogenase [Archangium violaceum]QRK12812.1 zinc-binding dehydrogenase [Archangium violaceum]
MKAAIFRKGDLVVDTLPDPVPGQGQVLVKSLACGICGSDLHVFKHAHTFTETMRRANAPEVMDLARDVVLGHEFCAEVLDYGPGSERRLKPGTRVTCMPLTVSADGVRTLGYSNVLPGGFAQKMLLDEALLLEVPNGLPSEHAALVEPMAVGVHAVEKAALKGGEVPLVIGCGPVGLAVIAALKLEGVHPIIAADYSRTRRALAEKMGADVVVDPSERSPYKTWTEHAAVKPAVLFECVGVPGMLQQLIEGAPPQARIVVVGVCMQSDQIEPFLGIYKELQLQFALAYTPEEFARTLRHVAEGELDVVPLITGRVGLEGVKEAFTELGNPERHAKILVEPWR